MQFLAKKLVMDLQTKGGKASSHGSPLGDDEIKLVEKNLNGTMNHSKYQTNFK